MALYGPNYDPNEIGDASLGNMQALYGGMQAFGGGRYVPTGWTRNFDTQSALQGARVPAFRQWAQSIADGLGTSVEFGPSGEANIILPNGGVQSLTQYHYDDFTKRGIDPVQALGGPAPAMQSIAPDPIAQDVREGPDRVGRVADPAPTPLAVAQGAPPPTSPSIPVTSPQLIESTPLSVGQGLAPAPVTSPVSYAPPTLGGVSPLNPGDGPPPATSMAGPNMAVSVSPGVMTAAPGAQNTPGAGRSVGRYNPQPRPSRGVGSYAPQTTSSASGVMSPAAGAYSGGASEPGSSLDRSHTIPQPNLNRSRYSQSWSPKSPTTQGFSYAPGSKNQYSMYAPSKGGSYGA